MEVVAAAGLSLVVRSTPAAHSLLHSVVLSKQFGSRSTVPGATPAYAKYELSPKTARKVHINAHVFLLDTIKNRIDDIVHYAFVIPGEFVVSEAHHTPAILCRLPKDFDYPVVNLLSRRFKAKKDKEQ